MNWLLLALSAPFVYSITNILDKYLVDKKIKNPIVVIPLFGLLGFVTALIIGSFQGILRPPLKDVLKLLAAGILFVLYTYPYYKAIQLGEASRVVPLFQLISIFSLILSYIFLGEILTSIQLVGFFLIFIGALVLSVERSSKSILTVSKPFWLMILSSFMYACAGIIAKSSEFYSDFWFSLTHISLGMGLGGLLLLLSKDIRHKTLKSIRIKNVLLIITVGNVLALLAQVAHIRAYDLAPIALINVVLGTQPFFILLLTVVVSLFLPKIVKEDLSLKNITSKLVPILIIFIGLYLIN